MISSCRDWSSRSESAPALRTFEVASLGIRGFIARNIGVDGEGVDQNVHHILVETPEIECNMPRRSQEESMTQHQGRHFLQIPGPSPVPDRVLRAMDMPVIDHRSLQFAELGRAVFEGCQKIFKTAGPVVIFPSSGTGAWEAAFVNTLSPGDKVLMVETGHFATLWRQMAGRFGIEVDFIAGDWRHGADPADIEARLAQDSAHAIKAVMVVHNETSTGATSRIGDIRAAMDRVGHPALLLVDTISSLGSVDYRHDEWK